VSDNPFLHNLTPELYDLLSALFDRFDAPAGTVICQQGEPPLYMYLLLDGKVDLRYKPYDGPSITLTRLRAGDVFGWSSVVGNTAYTSDAVSMTPVSAFRVQGAALRRLCTEYPSAGKSILGKLARAVSPRWIHAREQAQRVLQGEVFPED
jgi:CRP-like cAMP-binding protein